MDAKEFWQQLDISDKEHRKWEKRADKVIERYRLETEGGDGTVSPSFNVLWANTSVLEPGLFSQTPKPDITRRYKDDDPIGAHGSKIIERALEFVMDDGDPDFYDFGTESVRDYLLPGRTVSKVRYCPTYAKVRRAVEVEARGELGPNGESESLRFFKDDEELDRSNVTYREGQAFIEEDVEEVVDEHVIIERWPWKNFRHQKAKRWQDVGWVDYISYLDKSQLKKLFGNKAKQIELNVDVSGEENESTGWKPTHAEVHEVWVARERKVYLGVKGVEDKWMKEGDDPLRLDKFYPTPKPLMAVDTNDSLRPIPLFTLYQHQANELDLITKRISILMRALKLAGLYAGSEKETLTKLFQADENEMIPVADWATIKASGGISGLVEWLPIEQIGKVLTALFREREQIVAQIFELTGIADIQRGSTDPRETKGSQVIKAQFASRRQMTPKQEVERYFRDVLRIAAEIMVEHFSPDTLARMTGLAQPTEANPEQPQLFMASVAMMKDELQRQYRIDIETDSTVAPDEERDQANMAKALEAVTAYMEAAAPLAQSGVPVELLLKLLKTYLRKFKWGREVEETIEQLERNPPPAQPDPEEKKIQMEMQIEQEKAKLDQQKAMMEMQMKQKELEMKLQEMMLKLQFEQAKSEQELQIEAVKGQAEMQIAQQGVQQDQMAHEQQMRQNDDTHRQTMQQQKESASAKNVQVRSGNQRAN